MAGDLADRWVGLLVGPHCVSGDAAYYTLTAGGSVARNAVWTYEQPYPAVGQIAGHLAFYTSKVDAIEELNG